MDFLRITVAALTAHGFHYGHSRTETDTRSYPYILGERNGMEILNLSATLRYLRYSLAVLVAISYRRANVLFINPGEFFLTQFAPELENPYLPVRYTARKLPGALTNFRGLKRFYGRAGEDTSKNKDLQPIRRLPSFVLVFNAVDHHVIREAVKLNIPQATFFDSNTNSALANFYPLPANDDSLLARFFYGRLVFRALHVGFERFVQRWLFQRNYLLKNSLITSKRPRYSQLTVRTFSTFPKAFFGLRGLADVVEKKIRSLSFPITRETLVGLDRMVLLNCRPCLRQMNRVQPSTRAALVSSALKGLFTRFCVNLERRILAPYSLSFPQPPNYRRRPSYKMRLRHTRGLLDNFQKAPIWTSWGLLAFCLRNLRHFMRQQQDLLKCKKSSEAQAFKKASWPLLFKVCTALGLRNLLWEEKKSAQKIVIIKPLDTLAKLYLFRFLNPLPPTKAYHRFLAADRLKKNTRGILSVPSAKKTNWLKKRSLQQTLNQIRCRWPFVPAVGSPWAYGPHQRDLAHLAKFMVNPARLMRGPLPIARYGDGTLRLVEDKITIAELELHMDLSNSWEMSFYPTASVFDRLMAAVPSSSAVGVRTPVHVRKSTFATRK